MLDLLACSWFFQAANLASLISAASPPVRSAVDPLPASLQASRAISCWYCDQVLRVVGAIGPGSAHVLSAWSWVSNDFKRSQAKQAVLVLVKIDLQFMAQFEFRLC